MGIISFDEKYPSGCDPQTFARRLDRICKLNRDCGNNAVCEIECHVTSSRNIVSPVLCCDFVICWDSMRRMFELPRRDNGDKWWLRIAYQRFPHSYKCWLNPDYSVRITELNRSMWLSFSLHNAISKVLLPFDTFFIGMAYQERHK